MDNKTTRLVRLDTDEPIWERFYTVFPLVVVGTREADGSDDLAPKHLAIPMSWKNHFGFVCTPSHHTYQNIQRGGQFAVSYMRPDQTVLASLAASPRCEDGSKPITQALPTINAEQVNAPLVEGAYLYLECELDQIVDNLGDNSLIIGRIVGVQVAEDALRSSDQDDEDLLMSAPLLAYLYPGRFSTIANTTQLPFPAGFKR